MDEFHNDLVPQPMEKLVALLIVLTGAVLILFVLSGGCS
jgi:hypothetical protein